MRKVLLGLAALATIAALPVVTQPVHADPYKWCAQYSRGGGRNCGFVTLEQCQLTVSGIGGACEPNQFYTGPDSEPALYPRKSHRARKSHHDRHLQG